MSGPDKEGLTKLLKAESEAQSIVESARAKRRDMLKRATDEANREIDDFKKKRNAEFEEYKREKMAGIEELKTELEKATTIAVANVDKVAATHGDEVVQLLLGHVTQVDVRLPNAAKAV